MGPVGQKFVQKDIWSWVWSRNWYQTPMRSIIHKDIDPETVSVIPNESTFNNISKPHQIIKVGTYPEMSNYVRIYVFGEGKKTP